MPISPYVYPIIKHKMIPKSAIFNQRVFTRFVKEDVINALITEFNAPLDLLTAKSRKRAYVEPRKVYCKIAVFEMKRSKVEVGRDFPGYDHSIVIHACRTFDYLYKRDDVFRDKVDGVYARLGITNLK
jgi:chromosomal replication initiator protein